MIAGDNLQLNKDLSWWRSALQYVSDFSDVSMYGLGTWLKPGWDEVLPNELVLDPVTISKYRGLPFLYHWRISPLDLLSLGAGFGVKAGTSFLSRIGLIGTDLSINVVLTAAGEKFGVSRYDDELVLNFEKPSSIFWLSTIRLYQNGYTEYDINRDGYYVFYKSTSNRSS